MKRFTPAVLLFLLAAFLPGSIPIDVSSSPPPRLCGTTLTPEDVAKFQAEGMPQEYQTLPQFPASYCIPITAHIVRKSNGTGGLSLNQLAAGIQDCNDKYTGTGLHFILYKIVYLDSDAFYNNIDTAAEIDALVDNNPVANTVNVYCTANLADELGSLCGRGSFTTSAHQGIALNNDCVGVSDNDSSFPHELGHYFDLFHTHETTFGAELVDESNCTTAGDKLCDTPADPGLDPATNITGACVYTGTVKDANNAAYHPDTHQIMSYAPKLCRDVFSAQSQSKIVNTLTTKRAYLLTIGCPPDANAGTDITAECTSPATTAVKLDGSGSSDPEGKALTYKWSAGGVTFDNDTLQKPTGNFIMGTTTVQLVVFDGDYPDTDFVNVTIEDTTPPTMTCAIDTTVECSTHCGVPKIDLASWLAETTASDVCDPSVTVTNNAPTCFPDGVTTVKFRTQDNDGNPDSCTAKVTVVDTTPPVITVDMNRNVLWPPNHKLIECCASVTVTDVCDPNPTFVLYSVTSSEPDNDKGDGNTVNDIQDAALNTADLCYSLRSERQGGGDGRRYTIIYKASDNSGNVAYDTTCVCVPHDMSAGATCSSGFIASGAGLQNGASSFALVIPGSAAMNVYLIDPRHIYVGNSASTLKAASTRYVDANNDGRPDLAVMFTPSNTSQLGAFGGPADAATFSVEDGEIDSKVVSDGPIGLHFATRNGTNYLVPNIYALGAPVQMPEEPGKKTGTPQVETTTTPGTPAAKVTALTSIHPNPFNPQTTVDFSLATSASVRIVVYDVRGSLVRILVNETMQAGSHQTRWNGVDEAGQTAASGIYFVRMVAGSYTEVRKIVMLK